MEKEIAQWMQNYIRENDYLAQDLVTHHIIENYGDTYVYYKDGASNASISPKVLDEFKRLTEGAVVWSRGEKVWRTIDPDEYTGRSEE